MVEKWEWITKNSQIIKDITWQLEKLVKAETKLNGLANAKTEEEKVAKTKAEKEKKECLEKINNWKKTYPFEAQQLDQHLTRLYQKKKFSIPILNRRKKLVENIIKTL